MAAPLHWPSAKSNSGISLLGVSSCVWYDGNTSGCGFMDWDVEVSLWLFVDDCEDAVFVNLLWLWLSVVVMKFDMAVVDSAAVTLAPIPSRTTSLPLLALLPHTMAQRRISRLVMTTAREIAKVWQLMLRWSIVWPVSLVVGAGWGQDWVRLWSFIVIVNGVEMDSRGMCSWESAIGSV